MAELYDQFTMQYSIKKFEKGRCLFIDTAALNSSAGAERLVMHARCIHILLPPPRLLCVKIAQHAISPPLTSQAAVSLTHQNKGAWRYRVCRVFSWPVRKACMEMEYWVRILSYGWRVRSIGTVISPNIKGE